MPSARLQPGEISPADVEAARAFDRPALERVVAALLPRARNLVRYLIRGDQEVEDVVQEGLVAVLKGLPGYRAEGSFRSWADRVVARETFAWIQRRRALEGRMATETDAACEPAAGPFGDEFLARRQLVEALDTLPFEQRHALVLHHVLEMSVPEVAAATGAPQETVRSRLRLGRLRLKAALGEAHEQKVS
jgi:RNA polymerase sigma-70 factor, ECF subfamily